MARPCTVCGHPRRPEIDGALAAATPYRRVANQFDARPDAVYRHRRHLPIQVALVKAEQRARSYSAVLDEGKRIIEDIRGLTAQASLMFDFSAARAFLKEERRLFALLVRGLPEGFDVQGEMERLDAKDADLAGKKAAMDRKAEEVAAHVARARAVCQRINERLHRR